MQPTVGACVALLRMPPECDAKGERHIRVCVIRQTARCLSVSNSLRLRKVRLEP